MAMPERRVEALTVAMALAPGVYVRNRMFDFFAQAGVQRARSRAATLRGIVPQLGRACVVTLSNEGGGRSASGERSFVLRYEIPEMRMTRIVELTRVELATLRILAARGGLHTLPPDAGDRAIVDGALSSLLGADDTAELARAALE
jgi:hypothetical protein